MNLADQYRQMHKEGRFKGHSLTQYAGEIRDLIKQTGSTSLIDYGCGKAIEYVRHKIHESWGITELALYDPYCEAHDKKPTGNFDGLVCTDVLEHVEPSELCMVLADIFSYSSKFIFLGISTKEAHKKLPDGRNAHLIVEPPEWWNGTIQAYINSAKKMNKSLKVVVKYV